MVESKEHLINEHKQFICEERYQIEVLLETELDHIIQIAESKLRTDTCAAPGNLLPRKKEKKNPLVAVSAGTSPARAPFL